MRCEIVIDLIIFVRQLDIITLSKVPPVAKDACQLYIRHNERYDRPEVETLGGTSTVTLLVLSNGFLEGLGLLGEFFVPSLLGSLDEDVDRVSPSRIDEEKSVGMESVG